MYLISDALEIVHGDKAEQGILTGHGLLFTCASIHHFLVSVGDIGRIFDERGCEVSRCKVMIPTGSSRLTISSRSSIICTKLLHLVGFVGLMSRNALLWYH